MQFKLKTWALGSFPEIEISNEQFQSLYQSAEVLKAAMAIEEKYELVISNFLDLEKDSLAVSSDYMVRRSNNYSEFFDIRSTFNRRIVNLLTSTKLYIDQIQQHVKICNPELTACVKNEFSREYDTLFEYRFMEALRNYVQHRGLAVHLVSHPAKWIEDDESLLEFQTKIYTQKTNLEGDKAFKKSVALEMPDKVELILSSRKYISAISRVHSFIRSNIDTVVKSSRDLIESTINQYQDINDGESIGLCAVSFEADGRLDNIIERVPLFLSWDDVRIELTNRNRCISNLEKRYVSGKCL
ncbi:hypothetical protein Q9Y03_004976 [Vibrio harveyi]|uniref:hypothetical protein n=1 Tax=Vibrio harveyi TaxID=669 RepID=UPI002809FDF1|nr:hypothetical protein [Vibrio alginolyticus]ELB2908417.1 hypothetical protein [Vibrio alginolyticus]ELH4836979.1 hypothetical protein [Vibrio harveyi]HDM8135493.1 hypothetical protein [Vibrio harveyi]